MTVLAVNASNAGSLYRLGLAGESYATVHDDTIGAATNNPTIVEIGQDYTTSTNKYIGFS